MEEVFEENINNVEKDNYTSSNIYDIVDSFLCDDTVAIESPIAFWEKLKGHPENQQIYVESLIYKYISFSYGLGHKPLHEAIHMIKNIAGHSSAKPHGNTPSTPTNTHPKSINRSNSILISTQAQGRARAYTAPVNPRRRSSDLKSGANLVPRKSMVSSDTFSSSQSGKGKRKASAVPDIAPCLSLLNSEEERTSSIKMRDILYTISYLINTCDLNKWDFSKLREVFLVWNKARAWENTSTGYEAIVMKTFAKPPDNIKEDTKAEHFVSQFLSAFHHENENNMHMDEKSVGQSLKCWKLKRYLLENNHSPESLITCYVEILEKINEDCEKDKVISILHVLCKTILIATFIPIEALQNAYQTLQKFYLWPVPVSKAVKHVLNFIQIEMKSPGYFCRMIFVQEQEPAGLTQQISSQTSYSPANIFIDDSLSQKIIIETALNNFKSVGQADKTGDVIWQKHFIEHIFTSVFGYAFCDINALSATLETCPINVLTNVCCEASSIMEQAISKESYDLAQEFIKEKLQALSVKLSDGTKTVPVESAIQSETANESVKFLRKNSKNVIVVPPRNNSHLSRSVSNNKLDQDKCLDKHQYKTSDTIRIMKYPKITLNTLKQENLADSMFQIARSTAKTFVEETRQSGNFPARKRASRRRRSSLLNCIDDARDSGLIEDFETKDNVKHRSSTKKRHSSAGQHRLSKGGPQSKRSSIIGEKKLNQSESSGELSEEFWNQFQARGFGEDDNEHSLEDLIQSMEIASRSSLQSNKSEEHNEREQNDCLSDNFKQMSVSTTDLRQTALNKNEFNVPFSEKRNRKQKRRFKTFSKAKKIMKTVTRSNSTRYNVSQENDEKSSKDSKESIFNLFSDEKTKQMLDERKSSSSSNSPPPHLQSLSGSFFDTLNVPRWRTSSDPTKKSLRAKKSRNRYVHVSKIFSSTTDINITSSAYSFNSETPTLSFESLSRDGFSPSTREPNSAPLMGSKVVETRRASHGDESNILNEEDEDSRTRMDSGIAMEKSSERHSQRRSSSLSANNDWEDSGVAGVKFLRKQAVRKNRRSRSLSQLSNRVNRRKILKFIFVGNDTTIGHVARAYYELRKRQTTRAPLLNHLDLRFYYIPVGLNVFEDENSADDEGVFDLQWAELLGNCDPWFNNTVTMTINNLVRINPKMHEDDTIELESIEDGKFWAPIHTISESILSYSRFATNTTEIPMFKVKMRTSTNETIHEIFCCSVEIGSIAYTKAIKAGRFGKIGKLVDLSSGPPTVFTSFEFAKFGINGSFLSNKKFDEAFYYSVNFVPIALCGDQRHDQMRFTGADSLLVTLVDDEKLNKSFKKSYHKGKEDEILPVAEQFTVSVAKLDVIRPTQGTFTICIDNSIIHTNIKCFEVSRCIAPEYERSSSRKRNHVHNNSQFMTLPLKSFWHTQTT